MDDQWYVELVEDCKSIITEAYFNHHWSLVEGYWYLGKRINEDKGFAKFGKGNQQSLQDLAKNLKVNVRTVYYACQIQQKFPVLDKIPEGKNITVNKLITKYLPEGTPEGEKVLNCPHHWVQFRRKCELCGQITNYPKEEES